VTGTAESPDEDDGDGQDDEDDDGGDNGNDGSYRGASQKRAGSAAAANPKKGKAAASTADGAAAAATAPSSGAASTIRKPRSGYIFFQDYVRPFIKKEQPNLSPPQVLKEIGARWSSLSGKEKAPFLQKAEDDRSRYNKEVKSGGGGGGGGSGGAGGGFDALPEVKIIRSWKTLEDIYRYGWECGSRKELLGQGAEDEEVDDLQLVMQMEEGGADPNDITDEKCYKCKSFGELVSTADGAAAAAAAAAAAPIAFLIHSRLYTPSSPPCPRRNRSAAAGRSSLTAVASPSAQECGAKHAMRT
jgi:hypothetical protein